jgi:hypothetical protein
MTRVGWKGLLAFWLASTALATTFYVIRYWSLSPLSRYETLINVPTVALVFFLGFLLTFGILIWMVASFIPSPDEPEYFPPIAPSRELENTYELFSIPRRYQELLAAYREARRQAMAPLSFRVYFPGYIRQSFLSSLRPIVSQTSS